MVLVTRWKWFLKLQTLMHSQFYTFYIVIVFLRFSLFQLKTVGWEINTKNPILVDAKSYVT